MKKIFLLFFISFSIISFSEVKKDTISKTQLIYKFSVLEDQLKEVRRDQLNYKIEKDLLKETYENNYQRISLFITLVLGIFGVAGYIGIRDINSIKKEYVSELGKLKQLQIDISSKFKEFETSKEKYDTELRDIISTNEEQNKKIKVLELKEKIANLFKDKQYVQALEFCVVALELTPNDVPLLREKARLYTRTKNYNESILTYNKILELDNTMHAATFDLSEVYLLNNQRSDFNKIIESNLDLFKEKSEGKLLEVFDLIVAYQDNNIVKLKELSIAQINFVDLDTKKKRIENWDFLDILIYAVSQKDTEERKILLSTIWYLDGQLDGNGFFLHSGITNPNLDKNTENDG